MPDQMYVVMLHDGNELWEPVAVCSSEDEADRYCTVMNANMGVPSGRLAEASYSAHAVTLVSGKDRDLREPKPIEVREEDADPEDDWRPLWDYVGRYYDSPKDMHYGMCEIDAGELEWRYVDSTS